VDSALETATSSKGLRRGEESAFREPVVRHHGANMRFAETLVPSRAIAQEVAQEPWVGVIEGEVNQRVLVHRARSRIQAALDSELAVRA
jgi:DNA-directed RNA polymerase specialized sigma24 family protein